MSSMLIFIIKQLGTRCTSKTHQERKFQDATEHLRKNRRYMKVEMIKLAETVAEKSLELRIDAIDFRRIPQG